MSRSLNDANTEIGAVRDMPYGLARTHAAELQVRLVDADGPDAARAYALYVLVESYMWGGEVERAYVPFTRLVRWWDEHPELFDDADRHALHWSFKWMVANLADFPGVPVAQIERTLDDMERRYAIAGDGMDAVAHQRFVWARARGTGAVEAYDAWVATPRDDYSQCEACEPGDRAAYLFATGRTHEGIRLIERVLPDDPRCATEPADMLSHLALAYLDTGRMADAAATHRRAIAALEHAEGDMAGARGRHVELLARGGLIDRAVRMIVADQRLLVTGESPAARLGYLRHVGAATHVLVATVPDRTIRLAEVPATTLAELDAWVHAQAVELAAAFDRRNGTTHESELVDQMWRAVPSPEPLDLTVLTSTGAAGADGRPVARSSDDRVRTGARVASADGPDPDASRDGDRGGSSEDDPLAVAERLVAAGDHVGAAPRYAEASERAAAAGLLGDAGFALAEAARCAQVLGDHDGAVSAYTRATSLLRAGGVERRFVSAVVRAHAPSAAAVGQSDLVLGEIDRCLVELSEPTPVESAGDPALAARELAARTRELADLEDCAARLRATLGEVRAAAEGAGRAARRYAEVAAIGDAAHAFLLAGRLHDQLGDTVEAVWNLESAVEGFTAARDRTHRVEAASLLIGVHRRSGDDGQADEVARSLTR